MYQIFEILNSYLVKEYKGFKDHILYFILKSFSAPVITSRYHSVTRAWRMYLESVT